jgi:hypothetical protein
MEAVACMGPTQSLMRPSQDAVTTFDYMFWCQHPAKQMIKMYEPFRGVATHVLLLPWNGPEVLT